ncbi:hypothetical protein OLX02_04575 [Novosphingobium sp. KCTC 2891]|uniref:hypothetical protein n=1 Tax=Novosphingobium sp. KCTC 2891 TaxID=2989730 RepID=UPI0022217C75|nr:hypothetical protein [Novosphingobium sp. KCTC 2891]MCW1382089.1 hypothetical protein [Novosphingobium sp. KCTC 2891]
MAFDPREAPLRKREYEYAAPGDGDVAAMAAALKAMAAQLSLHPVPLLAHLAESGLGDALALAARQAGLAEDDVVARFRRCEAQVRRGVAADRGEPPPIGHG